MYVRAQLMHCTTKICVSSLRELSCARPEGVPAGQGDSHGGPVCRRGRREGGGQGREGQRGPEGGQEKEGQKRGAKERQKGLQKWKVIDYNFHPLRIC